LGWFLLQPFINALAANSQRDGFGGGVESLTCDRFWIAASFSCRLCSPLLFFRKSTVRIILASTFPGELSPKRRHIDEVREWAGYCHEYSRNTPFILEIQTFLSCSCCLSNVGRSSVGPYHTSRCLKAKNCVIFRFFFFASALGWPDLGAAMQCWSTRRAVALSMDGWMEGRAGSRFLAKRG
jgi:hypothetical protein